MILSWEFTQIMKTFEFGLKMFKLAKMNSNSKMVFKKDPMRKQLKFSLYCQMGLEKEHMLQA